MTYLLVGKVSCLIDSRFKECTQICTPASVFVLIFDGKTFNVVRNM